MNAPEKKPTHPETEIDDADDPGLAIPYARQPMEPKRKGGSPILRAVIILLILFILLPLALIVLLVVVCAVVVSR